MKGVDPNDSDVDERKLLVRLAAGEEEAFAALYDSYGGRLFGCAYALLGSRQEAEDTVQDVFTALVRGRQALTGVERLGPYLFASLRRAATRRLARRNGRPSAVDPALLGGVAEAHPAAAVDADDDRRRLEAALAALPEEQREVVALKIDGELTFAEIGDLLGVSPNTAASRYRYALEKLKAILSREKD